MASLGFSSLLLLSYIFVLAYARISPFPSSPPLPHFPAPASPPHAPKVSLALYYETLCPPTSNFIINHLAKIFDNGLSTIIDLKLILFGNAKINHLGDDVITCQFGRYECILNTIEACAIHVWPDVKVHFSFINCVQQQIAKGMQFDRGSCFDSLNLDPEPILDCYKSGRGKKLELLYGNVTGDLKPPHKYVPWVTVNEKPIHEEYEKFTSFVCKAYNGSHVPKAFKSQTHQTISLEKAVGTDGLVCFKDWRTKTLASSFSALNKMEEHGL